MFAKSGETDRLFDDVGPLLLGASRADCGNSVLSFGSPSYPSVMSHSAISHLWGVSRAPGES